MVTHTSLLNLTLYVLRSCASIHLSNPRSLFVEEDEWCGLCMCKNFLRAVNVIVVVRLIVVHFELTLRRSLYKLAELCNGVQQMKPVFKSYVLSARRDEPVHAPLNRF